MGFNKLKAYNNKNTLKERTNIGRRTNVEVKGISTWLPEAIHTGCRVFTYIAIMSYCFDFFKLRSLLWHLISRQHNVLNKDTAKDFLL